MIQVECRSGARAVRLLTALVFAILPGCMCLRSSCPGVTPACQERCEAMPRGSRGNVHVFLVNGFDPFGISGIGDAKATLHRLGFNNVYNGQFYHAGGFGDEIKEIAAADPNAHFVVVGIGAGVDAAVTLAENVSEYGVTIDLLASVDCPFWSGAGGKKPVNVQRVLSLHGQTTSWLPSTPGIEEDITIPGAAWLGVSSHPLTVETLASELATLAGSVPAEIEELPTTAESVPVPRPDAVPSATQAPSGSFLAPAMTLEGRDASRGPVPAIPVRREAGY